MVVVFVMHRKFAESLARKLAPTPRAEVRVNL